MLRKNQQEKINIPMAAMIDVVFLLLVFFILTYQEEIIEAHMPINLPAPTLTQKPKTAVPLLEIHVYHGRYLMMGNHPMTLDKIADTLITQTKYDPDQSILIRVSKKAQHKELIALLDLCNRVGLTSLNVSTLQDG
jgi:biopolymer transport protein ExbD